MKNKLFRAFVCFALCIAILITYVVPALAVQPSFTTGTFWETLVDTLRNTESSGLNVVEYLKTVFSRTDSGCTSSSNGYHTWVAYDTTVGLVTNNFHVYCQHCGIDYKEYKTGTAGPVTEDDIKDAYTDYTATLPAQEINSDGNLIWKPQIADIDSIKLDFIGSITHADSTATLNSDNNYSYHGTYVSIEPNQEGFLDCVINFRGGHTGVVGCKTRNFQIKVPISGVYSIIPLSKFEGYQEDEYHGNQELLHSDWSESEYNCFNGYLVDSASIPIITSNKDKRNVVGRFYLPIFNIEPQNVYNFNSSNTSDTYNRGTRAASITGNYGIVNGSGTVEQIGTQSIVNETNNTYYSPATGQPQSFTDWSYDYSDRSYTLTTTEGDTTTVTYGDEYVTINEGGNVTNIYYITEVSNGSGDSGNSGGGSDSPATSHYHSYTSSVTTAPSCTLPGVRTYTCSCGDSYTENIPATGHSWGIKTQVQTEYDENGEKLTDGYTIYKCTVCGEEYKEDSNTNVSPSSASASSQVTGVFSGIFGIFWDFIVFMSSLFSGFIKGGISAFLQALSDGTSEFFGLLNPVNWF